MGFSSFIYHKFSNKHTSPINAPLVIAAFDHVLFSFCKNPLEGGNILYKPPGAIIGEFTVFYSFFLSQDFQWREKFGNLKKRFSCNFPQSTLIIGRYGNFCHICMEPDLNRLLIDLETSDVMKTAPHTKGEIILFVTFERSLSIF